MKKLMLIGPTGVGKTTLMQYLSGEKIDYLKTQQVIIDKQLIDTPGEFIENVFYQNALITASVDAKVVAFVQSLDRYQNFFPPFFATRFTRPVIGIITKSELNEFQDKIEFIKKNLNNAGVKRIFVTSTYENLGMKALETFLLLKLKK
ncbi:MAG: EutP/PduV family microcompartment system protein [Streptococcaceae bacterium]|jgi:ethanolamine utilization protein EutP|nr:EutP/PduV family microcompartment system protein [Streptococcaceae bacterium]